MKDLKKLVSECEADLRSIGIKPGVITHWSVNTRAVKRWGRCIPYSGMYEIEISHRLLEDGVSDQAAKDTIVHEMLHTVKGCCNHGKKWKSLATKVNSRLPQYTIKRTTESEEKQIERPAPKYIVRCPVCGHEWWYYRKNRKVEEPGIYTHPKCKSILVRIK